MFWSALRRLQPRFSFSYSCIGNLESMKSKPKSQQDTIWNVVLGVVIQEWSFQEEVSLLLKLAADELNYRGHLLLSFKANIQYDDYENKASMRKPHLRWRINLMKMHFTPSPNRSIMSSMWSPLRSAPWSPAVLRRSNAANCRWCLRGNYGRTFFLPNRIFAPSDAYRLPQSQNSFGGLSLCISGCTIQITVNLVSCWYQRTSFEGPISVRLLQ